MKAHKTAQEILELFNAEYMTKSRNNTITIWDRKPWLLKNPHDFRLEWGINDSYKWNSNISKCFIVKEYENIDWKDSLIKRVRNEN